MELFLYGIAIIYGLLIGSFLNVLILRIPAGENFVVERSHCMKCGYQLSWIDMVPVFSYLFLGGKCRKCGEKISIQYPIIEALNAILYVMVFYFCGFNLISILYCAVTSALIVISVIDFRTYEIPLGLTLFIGVIGIIRAGMDLKHIWLYVIGMFSVGVFLELLFIVSRGTWIGGGDATLMMAAGLVLGWKNIIAAFMVACILGSIIHSIWMKISGASKVLALGPYLSMGIYLMMLFGDRVIDWYLGLIGL